MITINTWRDPYDAGFTTTKPKQVSFQPGLTVLVGCNGAGKSTLLMNIKEEVAEQKLPCHSYDNLVDGGNHLGAILGGYGEEGDDLALGVSLFTSSEGEEIKGNISRESRLYKSFLELGYYNNRDYKLRRIFKDEDEDGNEKIISNVRILLFDAVDSGMSVDAVIEVKALFDTMMQDAAKMGIELYLIISANEYELARGSQCFDVNTGKYLTFADYEGYRDFIIKSRTKKEVRNKKAAERNEKRRQKEIAALQKQYEKKLAKYQSLLKKEAAGEKLPYYEKYDAERDVKSIIRDLKDYGVEMPEFKVEEGKL